MNLPQISPVVLWFVILIEGFVTISAEILTIRQLLPVAGNSVIVTSLIIGVFLLFLAYGYRRGGQYKENYVEVLKRNFTLSAIWLGLGLSYIFIYWFFSVFRSHLHSYVLWALTAYLLVVTAPLVYILGQTVPITMNVIKQAETTGATGGKILHLSTIGSFLGAVVTSLLLMHFLGVAWTVFVNCALLALLTLILFKGKQDSLRIAILVVTLIMAYRFNVSVEKNIFVATNTYANYEVDNVPSGKVLVINGGPSSLIDSKNQAFPYIEYIKKILFQDLNFRNKDILILGAGGFSLTANGTQQNRVVYVDLDGDIHDVVKKNYLDKIQGEFIAGDARIFLQTTPKKYDAIVSDVYSNMRTIPANLLTREYFELVNNALSNTGIALFNIIARPMMNDAYSERVDNTIRSVFPHCLSVPIHYIDTGANIIYICQKNAKIQRGLYTDNLNQSTLDFFKSVLY